MNLEKSEIRPIGQAALRISILCFGLMTLGSTVRTTDSGLSCPDWPMCFGKLVPHMDIQIFLEWFHRLIALCLGLLLVQMGWKIFKSPVLRKIYSKEILLAFILFTWQCVLGGLTVLKLLDPSIVSSHLLTALLFFGLLLWIWRRSVFLDRKMAQPHSSSFRIKWELFLATVLVYLQLGIGGMVSSNNAGLICPDFPTCHGSWGLSGNFLVGIQMTHRYFAFALFAFSLFIFAKIRRERFITIALAVRLFPLLLALQILLGVLNIYFAMPLYARIAHHANGILIFTSVLLGTIDSILVSQGFLYKKVTSSFHNCNSKSQESVS